VKASVIPHSDVVLLNRSQTRALVRVIAGEPTDAPYAKWTHAVAEALLRSLTGNRRLTAHSGKRGALQYLISRGMDLISVSFKAKHSSIQHTRVYLGPEAWADAHHAHEMAVALL
jgi:hypothetical protein